jgi:DNA-binding PadR family transcriptional regulator
MTGPYAHPDFPPHPPGPPGPPPPPPPPGWGPPVPPGPPPGPPGAPGFGFSTFPAGPPPGFRRGPKARRGDVRAAVLALLAEEPRNGYQLIQAIARRSGGVWRPSSGSVYPTLQQLEDEGLAEARTADAGSRRVFALTEAGQAYVAESPEELAAPWDAVADAVDDDAVELWDLLGQVTAATGQVVQAGGAEQYAQTRQVLVDARRSIYRILADADPAPRTQR